MELPLLKTTTAAGGESGLASRLRERVRGDVRFDPLARTLYATDASIYEITPVGVVMPKCVEDVVATVRIAAEHGVTVTPRGAATGLTGGAVGGGVQVDLSRHMNRILDIDPAGRTATVEPGVVLDELNATVAPHGLHFAPDVATASRATIGGMIANNSCGAHSIVHGRTVDHVLELTIVLADGSVVTFGKKGARESGSEGVREARKGDGVPVPDGSTDPALGTQTAPSSFSSLTPLLPHSLTPNAGGLARALGDIRDRYADEIAARFPKLLRSNGGYGLDRLGPPGTPAETIGVLCGSEGTLGIVVRAKLRLTPLPAARGLVILHFADIGAALAATPQCLEFKPAAVELIDRMILDAAHRGAGNLRVESFITADPGAVLIVEFFGESSDAAAERVKRFVDAAGAEGIGLPAVPVLDPRQQAQVWSVRTSGLGLMMSKPGERQSHAFVEDTAVDPAKLKDYIADFAQILADEGAAEAGYYAHASVGCIHVRPVLNLRDGADVARMARIAERVCDLAMRYGGTMTGEHGDGLLRSQWLQKLYGPRILEAFREVKDLFDPRRILNPGKIVDPLPMTEYLRFGGGYRSTDVKSTLSFAEHGGPAGMAQMCSGVGACRKTLGGTMCPSYMATRDETDTTRARANALRIALSDGGLLDGLTDPRLAEVMDLCLACKACKSECPTGVDMARLKAEYLHAVNLARGVNRGARFIADMPERLALASRLPRLMNLIGGLGLTRRLAEWRFGLDRRIAPPRLATQTFRAWLRRHRRRRGRPAAPRGPVAFFADTWTNYFTPQVGIAAVRLLEAAGYEVLCPPHGCCGRPLISQGLLHEARQRAEMNLRTFVRFAREGTPIVGVEPSCILTFVDEMPRLLDVPGVRRFPGAVFTVDEFLGNLLRASPDALRLEPREGDAALHVHCHQKALTDPSASAELLARAFAGRMNVLDAGCCGMAGAFGHQREHYDVARRIGEHRLFPAIRQSDAAVAVTGFSCRHQIHHHTGSPPAHALEWVASALTSE